MNIQGDVKSLVLGQNVLYLIQNFPLFTFILYLVDN